MAPEEVGLAISLARGPLIGTFLGLFLYGVTCMQACFYFFTYDDDHRRLKLTVALLVTLETIHAAMSIWLMDDYLIKGFGNVEALKSANGLSTATYILGLLIDFLVYQYFTWRIWIFTKSAWIAVIMTLISISRTGISIAASALSVLQSNWRDYLTSSRTLLLIGNVLFIFGDTISATSMAYQLTKLKHWAHTYHHDQGHGQGGGGGRPRRRIEYLLNRLLMFVVATGTLTVFVDVIALILTLSQPQSLAFLSAILVQTRLYANSLLASLNIRKANSRAYDNAPSTIPSLNIHMDMHANMQTHAHVHMNHIDMQAISLRFARPSVSTSDADEYVHDRHRDRHRDRDRGRDPDVHESHRPSVDAICPRKSTAESWHTAQNESFSSLNL